MANPIKITVVGEDRTGGALNSVKSGLAGIASTAAQAGKALTLALGGTLVAGFGAAAVSGLRFNNSMEQVTAQLNAFTKDGEASAEILDMIRERAAKTPFAFNEMASATAGLLPTAKQSGAALEDLIGQAEILAASNPAEGLEGAAFALREAVSGDFTSIIERFNLPRSYINQLKEEGVPALEIVSRAMAEMGYDADLVANMAETLEGRWGTFTDTLQGVAATATKPIFDRLSEGLGSVNALLAREDIQAKLGGIAEVIGVKLGNAFDWIVNEGAPRFMAVWGLLRDSFITFQQALSGNWADDGIIHPLHRVVGVVGQVVAAFREGGLKEAFGVLLPYAQEAFNSLIGYVQGKLPEWLVQLGAWGKAAWNWLEEAIPPLLVKAGELATQLLNWAGEQVGPLMAKLGEWSIAFLNWVTPVATDLALKLGDIALKVFGWLSDTALEITGKLITEWIPAFLGWVASDLIPKVVPTLQKAENEIVRWVVEVALPVFVEEAKKWAAAFLDWVGTDVVPFLANTLDSIKKSVSTWVGNSLESFKNMVKSIGGAIIDGIIAGFGDIAGRISGAITGGIRDALSRVQLDQLIESPSKLWAREVGAPIIEGVARGVQMNARSAQRRIVAAVGGMLPDMMAAPSLQLPALSGGTAVGAAGGGAGSTSMITRSEAINNSFTINVYPQTQLDLEELYHRIGEMAARRGGVDMSLRRSGYRV